MTRLAHSTFSFPCSACHALIEAPLSARGLRRHCLACRAPALVPGERVSRAPGARPAAQTHGRPGWVRLAAEAPASETPRPASEHFTRTFPVLGILLLFTAYVLPQHTLLRLLLVGGCVFLCALAYGLYKHQYWAWLLGLVVLVVMAFGLALLAATYCTFAWFELLGGVALALLALQQLYLEEPGRPRPAASLAQAEAPEQRGGALLALASLSLFLTLVALRAGSLQLMALFGLPGLGLYLLHRGVNLGWGWATVTAQLVLVAAAAFLAVALLASLNKLGPSAGVLGPLLVLGLLAQAACLGRPRELNPSRTAP